MKNLTLEEFLRADFSLYEKNPIIRNPLPSLVIADPSILTPDMSHDGKWHLFCHTFFGVYRYESSDGISFTNKGRIVNRGMRPYIAHENGRYYLFYERTRSIILNALSLIGVKWKSEIYVTESDNLTAWTEPRPLITQTRDYEISGKNTALSNPFHIEINGKHRMYYSCGLTFIKDCGFSEPTHISYAESDSIAGNYTSRKTPVISPDKNIKWLNLCSGCLKVYKLKDCYIGLQNGIYEENGKSHSAIVLLSSEDGESFKYEKHFLSPQVCGKSKWMAQYVYACCLTYYDGKLRVYFNARNVSDNIRGRECIGFTEAVINK